VVRWWLYPCMEAKPFSSLDGVEIALAVASIMIGLSLALKATVEGLLVTIPCVVMNNVLQRCVNELLAQYEAQHGS
jgi:biopolymer transport protein ExbB